MYSEIIKERLKDTPKMGKGKADKLAFAAILLMSTLVEKYPLDPESEKKPIEDAIKVLETFVELPM